MALPRLRQVIALIAACILLLTMTPLAQARPEKPNPEDGDPLEITVKVNGQTVNLPADRQPYIVNGRTMFPLRYLLEMIGAKVDWGVPDDHSAEIAWVETSDTILGFPIGRNYMSFDGEYVPLDQGAVLSPGGFTMVPMRHVIERLGGTVTWNATTRTASFTLTVPSVPRSIRQKCELHGYDIDAKPKQPGACTQNLFFIPDALAGYGHPNIKKMIWHGVTLDGYAVQYLNTVASAHHGDSAWDEESGRSPGWAQDADRKIDMLVGAIMLVMTLGESLAVQQPATEEELESSVSAAAFVAPKSTGWAYPEGGQTMSEEAMAWQSEVSGQVPELIKAHGGTSTWRFMEYGYTSSRGGYWFDAFQDGVLVDAKTIPAKWIGADGKLTSFAANILKSDWVSMARRQVEVVREDRPIEWWFRTAAERNAWVQLLQDNGLTDILRRITFR